MAGKLAMLSMVAVVGMGIEAADTVEMSGAWQVMAVKAESGDSTEKVLPERGEWKNGDLHGKIPLASGAKGGNLIDGEYNAWYKKTFDIPADWRGRSVRYEQDLNFCAVVVFVNGRQAGVAHFPDGSVELSHLLKYGAANEIKLFVTNRGYGTGEGAVVYRGRGDYRRGFGGAALEKGAKLVARSAAYIDDVYARPSFRGTMDAAGRWDGKKKLAVEVEIESINALTAELQVQIANEDGSPACAARQTAALVKGANKILVDIPFEKAIPWETVPDAKLYTCQVTMKIAGAPADDRRGKFLFGFREIWREGRQIMMNGHPQRFRGFWQQGMPAKLNDLHLYGYNLAYETHKHWAILEEDAKALEAKSRAGIAVFAGMPTIVYAREAVRKDPTMSAQWRRCLKHYLRTMRNYPCIVAVSCGVNQICPERNMRPEFLGQDLETNGVAKNIEYAREQAREMHPNCLYFSHADGTEADISSSNLYFNFTPLQEREEWLGEWSRKGILPWYAAEFGAPYYACWFHSRVPEMTEWLAVYYGEAAYEAEDVAMLEKAKDFAKSCRRLTHGGWVDNHKDLYAFNALGEEYSRMSVYRINRAWRAFGQNGGLMYLTSWNWDKPNAMRDRQMQANGEIVTFLGGDPEPTDRTHAYRQGDEIRKNLVFVWDGCGENTLSAQWKLVAVDGGKIIASGGESVKLRQGDIVFKPIKVLAPKVSRRTAYRFEVTFSAARGMDNPANRTVMADSFELEVYPIKTPKIGGEVALFDPSGETEKILQHLGIKVAKYDSLAAALAANPQRLVVGYRALSGEQGLEQAVSRIAAGMRVMVMQQKADVWQLLGFKVEDSMARRMYNVALPGIDNRDLEHWTGSPIEDVKFGNVMKHETRRGPRWTFTHAVSATPLLIPQRAGFLPLVRGEFDLSYSALLKAPMGKGHVMFCAFDFEGRVGTEKSCPAATAVCAAMMREFVKGADPRPSGAVYTDGAHAERIARTLGLDAKKYDGGKLDAAVLIVGKDSALGYPALAKALGKNAHALVVANDAIAGEACGIEPAAKFYRADGFPMGGVSRSLLRFRDAIDFRPLKGGGAFALIDGGRILIDQLDPFQAGDRYRTQGGKAAKIAAGGWGMVPKDEKDLFLRNASQSEDNFMRRYAIVLGAWGVGAGEKVFARALYTKPAQAYEPIAQYNVLGPWPSANDDDHYMVDTIFPVEASKGGTDGAEAEAMAIRGDVQPNPRFYPKGLTYLDETPEDLRFVDWRPVAKSRADGFVDYSTAHPLIAAQAFATCYCVGFLPRRTDGEITIRFGVDWRGKIWVNGKAFDPIYGGHKDEGSVIYENVKVWGMPPPGTDLKKFDREHGTFDGKNVIAIKAGCGQSAKTFWLNVSHEPREGEVVRTRVAELDGIDLYETANVQFDPYEYVYW